MDGEGESCLQEIPEDVEVLKTTILELKERERKLIQEKQDTENEFGKQRAKIKDIFMSKEEYIDSLQRRVVSLESELQESKSNLKTVVSECDAIRTAAAVLEDSQKEEAEVLNTNHQDELASLQHIMREAVQEARGTTAQQFELERHSLIAANKKLEMQVKELQTKDGKGTGVMSAMSDAVAGVVRRSSPSAGQSKDKDVTLEEGMKKARQDAEAWKSIVQPLEQELVNAKTKLKDEQEKCKALEAKLKIMEKEAPRTDAVSSYKNVEELQEKVKELNQYLDSERSSRTDLEMFVAVLNTQKGVLQEDADKLRKEIQSVCKILEQEKTAHRELKKTWQMANDRFLDNLQMQESKLNLMWGILSKEQRLRYKEEQQNLLSRRKPHIGQLVDVGLSPTVSPVSSIEKAVDVAHSLTETGSHISDISNISYPNSLTSIEASDREGSNDEDDETDNAQMQIRSHKRSHSASDSAFSEVNDIDVSRHKSADDLSTGSPPPIGVRESDDDRAIRQSPLLDVEPSSRTISKGGRIDWGVFQEEVKVSHESEMSRSCVMCTNYEKQLQKVEADRQKFRNLSSNLQIALEQEKKALFEEQRLRSRLEQCVANAGQDAQTQINEQSKIIDKLDQILVNVQRNFAASKKEATAQIAKLTASRNELQEELTRLRAEYITLQDSALQQLTQMDTDSRLAEVKEQLMQVRSAGEGTEEKLRGEIAFLKERAIAEQMNKDSMEEMLLSDVESYKTELGQLSQELKHEKQRKQEADAKIKHSEEVQRNVETKSRQVIIALRGQLEESSEEKKTVEEEVKTQKNQIKSLTAQLNESETVQRDFVKLSQSLQMQIVTLQESEQEVRWEHKDDVRECHKCKKTLNSNKDKVHCHHCGKIFCDTCRSKTFSSRVTRRAHQVCELCHAMLSNDSKAMFNDHLNQDNS